MTGRGVFFRRNWVVNPRPCGRSKKGRKPAIDGKNRTLTERYLRVLLSTCFYVWYYAGDKTAWLAIVSSKKFYMCRRLFKPQKKVLAYSASDPSLLWVMNTCRLDSLFRNYSNKNLEWCDLFLPFGGLIWPNNVTTGYNLSCSRSCTIHGRRSLSSR